MIKIRLINYTISHFLIWICSQNSRMMSRRPHILNFYFFAQLVWENAGKCKCTFGLFYVGKKVVNSKQAKIFMSYAFLRWKVKLPCLATAHFLAGLQRGLCLLTEDATEPSLPAFLSVWKVINSEFAGGVESMKEWSAAHRGHEQALNNDCEIPRYVPKLRWTR